MTSITLRILCEGQTEANFANRMLKPHLAERSVFVQAQPLVQGQFGIVSYEKLRKAIRADIGVSRAHEYVTTMVDLYRLGSYPDQAKVEGEAPYDRMNRIEEAMARELPSKQFLPYVQLHEFEALVLVDLGRLPAQVRNGEADRAPEALRLSIGDTPPELVNDGEHTAPAKRIIKEVPSYAYTKAIAGPAIAGEIGLQKLRLACPHFHEWISKLERLGAEG